MFQSSQLASVAAHLRKPYEIGRLLDNLEQVGISREEVRKAQRTCNSQPRGHPISTEAWELLTLLEAVRKIAPPDIGLRMGQLLHMTEYGSYYSRFNECRTMGEARLAVRQFSDAARQAYFYREEIDSAEWIVDFALPIPMSKGAHVLIDNLIARSKFEIEHLLGQPIRFRRIEVPFPEPRHKSVYESMFDCRIAFDKRRARVVLDSDYLALPCAIGRQSSGAAISPTEEEQACGEPGLNTSERVSLAILETLIFDPGSYPSLKQVAGAFRVSTSTVKRWLSECELTYRLLVDLVRREHVAEYLAFTDLAPKEIAFRLGFTNVHNFRRAFRRWIDMTPAQFRLLTQV